MPPGNSVGVAQLCLKPMHSILGLPVRLWCLQPRCTTCVAPHRVMAHTAMWQSTFVMLSALSITRVELGCCRCVTPQACVPCMGLTDCSAVRSLVSCIAWKMKQTAAGLRACIFWGAPVTGWQNIQQGHTSTATAHAARAVRSALIVCHT